MSRNVPTSGILNRFLLGGLAVALVVAAAFATSDQSSTTEADIGESPTSA